MINEVMERTILKRQDIINWFVNEGYDDYFFRSDTDELIDVDLSEYKKGNEYEQYNRKPEKCI